MGRNTLHGGGITRAKNKGRSLVLARFLCAFVTLSTWSVFAHVEQIGVWF
ncbi:MAG: hypothetical protein ACI9FJ_000682 [Alteromonadaceae bacterium]|jgi:hypothetical protein